MIKQTGLCLLLTILFLQVNGQQVPELWPAEAGKVIQKADTTCWLDENGQIRLRCWYESTNRDSVFETFGWEGKLQIRFTGKRRNPLSGCAQFFDTKSRLQESSCWTNDRLQDPFAHYFSNGIIEEQGRYENGTRQGLWKTRYENGKPRSTGSYVEDLKTGVWTFFHPDSSVAWQETWEEGSLLGVSDFTTLSGKQLSGGGAKNGIGAVRRYHLSGIRKQVFRIEGGQPEGLFQEYDSTGRLLRAKSFYGGELSGNLLEFYADSTVASITHFEKGLEEGAYMALTPEGNPVISGWFRHGKEDSVWTEMDSKGLLSARYSYKNGQLNGWYQEFYPGQKPKKHAFFRDGQQDSLSESWNEKGMKVSSYLFKEGEKNGPAKEWYPNGKPQSEGQFWNDLEQGNWTYWFENGQVQSKGRFEKGRPTGEWVTYYGNGKLASQGMYQLGDEDGIWQFFYPDGSLKTRERWKEGRLLAVEKCMSPKGKKLNCGTLIEGIGSLRTFDLDGLPEGEGEMADGIPTGNWKYFYPRGNVQAEGKMEKGKRTGLWKFYEPDGKLLEETTYLFDKPIGKSKQFENGKLVGEE